MMNVNQSPGNRSGLPKPILVISGFSPPHESVSFGVSFVEILGRGHYDFWY